MLTIVRDAELHPMSISCIPTIMREFIADMRIAKYSTVTIEDRVRVIQILAEHLDVPLLEATGDDLRAHQSRFAHLSPATVNIYSRHIKAFYDWAAKRRLITENPAAEMTIPQVPHGRPHPTSTEDLALIFACTRGPLRIAYVLAAFAGLRRGEICRLHRRDMDLSGPDVTALIHGKGGKERIVPLIAPVMAELQEYGLTRGWVITRIGQPYPPEALSVESTKHLHGLGLDTTLHSMRGTFATNVGRSTRDPLFARDLLGHGSVATTEIYMQTSLNDAHRRLGAVAAQASGLLGGHRTAVRSA